MRISYLNRFLFMPRQFSFKLNLKLRIFLLLLLLLVLWQCTCTKDLCFALNLLLYFFFLQNCSHFNNKKKNNMQRFSTHFSDDFSHTLFYSSFEKIYSKQKFISLFIVSEKIRKEKFSKKLRLNFFLSLVCTCWLVIDFKLVAIAIALVNWIFMGFNSN